MDEEEIELLERINLFFEDPRTVLSPPGEYGTLYLLRRDALRCFGCKPDAIKGDLAYAITECGCLEEGVLFPGAMVVLAGIDLLAKFHAGSEQRNEVGPRFKEFVTTFFASCSADVSQLLWVFRNALMHSFGLWGSNNGKPVLFNLRFAGGPIVEVSDSGSICAVDVHTLHREFERGVARYREALDSQQAARDNFDEMFGHYGKVTFTGQLLQPHELFGPYSFSPYHRTELGPQSLD